MKADIGSRKRICCVATVASSLDLFMLPHLLVLRQDFDVTLVAGDSQFEFSGAGGEAIDYRSIRIERNVSLLADIQSLWRLFWLFRKLQPDAVHSITPKAGLLAMLAARLAGVPIRCHTFTGQVWATEAGLWRWVLKTLDRVLVLASTHVLADSPSQARFLDGEGVARLGEITVLGDGSICGVDVERFSFDPKIRGHLRASHEVPEQAVVFLYVGRLKKDKGVLDLLQAFAKVADASSQAHLMLVGLDEDGLTPAVKALADRYPGRVHQQAFSQTPEYYMSMCDVFCLPSYREGFGSTLIEAAAIGMPSIASRIYGVTDAVVDGETGLLHTAGNVEELSALMGRLLADDPLRDRLGSNGRRRAVNQFSQERLTAAMARFYKGIA
ncbi:MAG: glycosyltransferase [Ramlibacter sp.]